MTDRLVPPIPAEIPPEAPSDATGLSPQSATRGASSPYQSDVLVIGAGVGGLTAAALLARRGARVTVLDADTQPGGCAAGFSRKKYRFAVGATIATGFQPGGLHDQVYHALGLTPRVHHLDAAMDFHLPDRRVRFFTDHAAWDREWRRAFPEGSVAGKAAFWAEVRRMGGILGRTSNRHPTLPLRTAGDLVDLTGAFRPEMLRMLPYLRATLETVLERHGIADELAHRRMIDCLVLDAMQCESDRVAALNGMLTLDIYRQGCHYVEGGLETIGRDLVSAVKRDAGEVLFKRTVRRILLEEGRVVGVEDQRGRLYRASTLVSAIPLGSTLDLLGDAAPSTLRRSLERRPEGWGACTVYLGVDARVIPEGLPLYNLVLRDYHRPGDDGNSVFVSISPEWDTRRAPPGKRAITLSTHTEARPWFALEPDAYEQRKQSMIESLIDAAAVAVPGLREGIEVLEAGTPLTFQRYTRRPFGMVGGIPQTVAHSNLGALSRRSGVAGLWLAGDTVFPGQGVIGVTLGGILAAKSAARELKLKA